jgi:hypothetical protein
MDHITPDENVYYLKSNKDFPFKDEDFLNNEITTKDKEFLKSLLIDDVSSFDLVYSDKFKNTKVNTFYSSLKYLPNVTCLKDCGVIKTQITTDYSFEKVLNTLVPLYNRRLMDKGFTEMELVKEIPIENSESGENFPTIVQTFEIQTIKLLKPKKVTSMNSYDYNEKSKLFCMYVKPCKP